MSYDGMMEDQKLAKQSAEAENAEATHEEGPSITPAAAANALKRPMGSVQRQALVQSLGQSMGNKAVQRLVGGLGGKSKAAGLEGGTLEDEHVQKVQNERPNGQPIAPEVRRKIERKLGADLSKVRVHTGNASSELARSIGALAFTTGRDIFFSDKRTPSDEGLLAHEATHAIEQGFHEKPPTSVGAAHTDGEKRAEHNASSMTSGSNAMISSGGVQREVEEEEPVQASRDTAVQREGAPEEEEVQTSRDTAVQREGAPEEEEPVQMSRDTTVERAAQEEEEVQTSRDTAVQREAEGGEAEEEEMSADTAVQREGEEEETEEASRDTAVQREAAPEEEEVQTSRDTAVQREAEGGEAEEEEMSADTAVQREGDEEEMSADLAVERQEDEDEVQTSRDLAVQRHADHDHADEV